MTPDESALWSAIAAYPLAGGDGIDLAGQLVAKQGWARPFAEGAVEEYRRFCFLACIADFMVSPSEEVDEVWHLHMLHSRDYWDRWCADVLGRKLHHEPGAPGEARRFHEGYARTLALYEDYFGQPSEAFWPGTRQRFRARARFRIVDRDRVMVIPRPPSLRLLGRLLPLAVVLVLLAVAMPAMALPLGPLDWDGPDFLGLYSKLVLVLLPAIWLLRRTASFVCSRNGTTQLDPVSLAYIAGGARRAADTAVVCLTQEGAANYSDYRGRIIAGPMPADLPPLLQDFYVCIGSGATRRDFHRRATPILRRLSADLVKRGLIVQWHKVLTMLLPIAVLAFGIVKLIIGVARDKPVGSLVAMVIVVGAMALLTLLLLPILRTDAGGRLLSQYRSRHRRATRAPISSELGLAVALGGVVVLVATPLAGYARVTIAGSFSSSGNSSDSGGSSCGGGGGSSGGSSCGGCSSS